MTSHRRAFDGTERRETTDDEAVYRKRGKWPREPVYANVSRA